MRRRDRILGLLLHADHWMSSTEIADITHIGWLFAITMVSLERDGLVESAWEPPHFDFALRRRVYRLKPRALRNTGG